MIFVGATGGRCAASSALILRPSPATSSSPSRRTGTHAPSSRIRRYSGMCASRGLAPGRSRPALGWPVEPQVHLSGPDRVLVIAERASRRDNGLAAERGGHHQVVRELRFWPHGQELTHRVYHSSVVACLQPCDPL